MNHLTRNAFPEVRQDGDVDLVAEITAKLQAASHPNPQAWLSAPEIVEAKPAAPRLQRFLIARHYRLKFATLEKNTTTERFVLENIDAVDSEYLKWFGDIVVPTLVKFNL